LYLFLNLTILVIIFKIATFRHPLYLLSAASRHYDHILKGCTFLKGLQFHDKKMNASQKPISIKGRTCYPTPLVRQDVTKKPSFFMKKI